MFTDKNKHKKNEKIRLEMALGVKRKPSKLKFEKNQWYQDSDHWKEHEIWRV